MINRYHHQIKAVAFDLDGTLIDSMTQHADAWAIVLSEFGYQFDRDLYLRSEGIPLRTLLPIVTGCFLNDLNILDQLISAKDNIYRDYIKKAQLVDGGRDLILYIKSLGLPVGLVTAGHRDRVSRTLFESDIALFDTLICGDDSIHGKPLPHPYLEAATALKTQSKNLLVIENAVCGAVSSYLADAALIFVGHADISLPNQLARCDSIQQLLSLLTTSELLCTQS